MLHWNVPRFLLLLFLAVSCMDLFPPPPAEGFVKLSPEYADLNLMRAEDDWFMLYQDFQDRLGPASETVLKETSAYFMTLQDCYNQFVTDELDLKVIVSKVLTVTNLHLIRISANRVFAQGIQVKIQSYNSIMNSLMEIYHSEHEIELTLDFLREVTRTRDWLKNVEAKLGDLHVSYHTLLTNMMIQMASKLYASLQVDEVTAMSEQIEAVLNCLELSKPEALVLEDLRQLGNLILEFEQSFDKTAPLVSLFEKLCERFPKSSDKSIPDFLERSESYAGRHLKLCRRYLALNPVESDVDAFDLAELDIMNEEKFNWRRFRNEFIHYFHLRTKSDGNPRVSKALFGKGYKIDSPISFVSGCAKDPLQLAEEYESPMLVNFPSCPHDIPQLGMIKMSHVTICHMPSVNISAFPEYKDGVTFDCLEDLRAGDDTILDDPKICSIMNPKGLDVLRHHIYTLFSSAIRNRNTTLILASEYCETCQMYPGQVAELLRDAARVLAGRGLLNVVVCDSLLFNHISKRKQ